MSQRKSSLRDNDSGKKGGTKLKKWVKEMDMYGKPVTMTYRGKETFKTTFGGIVSLILVVFLLSVFGFKLQDMFQHNNTEIKKNTLVSISNSYTPPENISNKNITIAFQLSDFYGDGSLDDPRYGKFVLTQFIDVMSSDGNRVYNNYNIPFSKCKLGVNFFYPNQNEI